MLHIHITLAEMLRDIIMRVVRTPVRGFLVGVLDPCVCPAGNYSRYEIVPLTQTGTDLVLGDFKKYWGTTKFHTWKF